MLPQSNPLVLLSDPSADTLVVIGAPPQQSDQSDTAYAPIKHHFANHHRIDSRNLLTLGSAKFNAFLGPSSQYRTERRLRKEGFLQGGKPSGIKYLLDLRPPSEDEDAIVLITGLSCSAGTLRWFKAKRKYRIPASMVCGQDELVLLRNSRNDTEPTRKMFETLKESQVTPEPPSQSSLSGSKPVRIGNWDGVFPAAPVIPDEPGSNEGCVHGTDVVGSSQKRSEVISSAEARFASTREPDLPPEYSQLRHWSAIERLLHAIEGKDPMLDSAPKVWTFYAVADYFGCASNDRIYCWITKWLFAAPNHNFVQCNPEVCYRIGHGIQSEVLVKETFSLLVGEKALLNVHRDNPQVKNVDLQVSVAGRKLELLDDDELNRIDHAANSFIRRIQSRYNALIGQEMLWLEQSRLFGALSKFFPSSRKEDRTVRELIELVKNYVRSRILWVLVREYGEDMPGMEIDPTSVRTFYPHASAQFVMYNQLSKEERIFTRFFWMALQRENLHIGDNSISTNSSQGPDCPAMVGCPLSGLIALSGQLLNVPGVQVNRVQNIKLPRREDKCAEILDGSNSQVTPKGVRGPVGDDSDPYMGRKPVKTEVTQGGSEVQPRGMWSNAFQSLLRKPSPSGKGKRQEVFEFDGDPSFSIDELLIEITNVMHGLCDDVLIAAHFFRDTEIPPTDLIDSLMCLTDNEWQYLPLWAGGNDDGSGGVFNDIGVPSLEAGGFTVDELGHKGMSCLAGSSSWSEAMSTVGKASREANHGTATEIATVHISSDADVDLKWLPDELSTTDVEMVLKVVTLSENNRDSDDEGGNNDDRDSSGDGYDDVEPDDVETGEEMEIAEGLEWDDCQL